MKQIIKLLFFVVLTLCMVQGALAADFVETTANIDPASGDLVPGEQVTVHVIVALTGSGENTFDTADSLEAYTELDDPEWDYVVLVNGQGIPKESTSQYVRLLGWDLAYPDSNTVTVDYTLVGTVPTVPQTSDVTLFRLRQLDVNGNIPSGGEILIKPTVTVNPEMQFITATTSSATIAKGDELHISGTAEGNSTESVALWVLGIDCASYATENVEENGAFEYIFGNTAKLAAGQYYVVVQHPMNNSQFDLVPQAGNPEPGQSAVIRPIIDAALADPLTGIIPPLFIIEGSGSLRGSDAAAALVNAINNADIDDTYYELTFMVEDPWIQIDTIDDRYVGETITFSGITNIAVGETLNIAVASLNETSASGTTLVTTGETAGVNHWAFSVDTATFSPDRYAISVYGSGSPITTQTFNILEADLNHYITITPSGNSSYYIGEDVVLSGENTNSNTTWLFITGPNLPSKGGSIEEPCYGVNTASISDPNYPNGSLDDGGIWTGENVTTENTWEYTWDTSGINLDAGIYTIYAISTATNQYDLNGQDSIYARASIEIKKPFVTASATSAIIAKGDGICIEGNAYGEPTRGVGIWIFGRNYASYTNETVDENSTFEYQFSNTTNLATGQYFAIVQHPMYNDEFDLAPQADNPAEGQTSVVRPILDAPLAYGGLFPPVFIIEGTGSLQGSDAATALVNAMKSPDIDDTYCKLTFTVEQPWIQINTISDKYTGETFSISGTTNLAAEDDLTYTITPLNSAASVQNGTFSVQAGTTPGTNTFELTIDSSAYTPGTYMITAERVPLSLQTTQSFTILQTEQNNDITINTLQSSPYYPGEDILISGTNNKSETTWLFVSGPGTPETGGSVTNPLSGVHSATNANGLPVSPYYPDGYLDSGKAWNGVNVAADNTWEYRWMNTGTDLNAGTYTIYAVTTATDKGDLGSHLATYAIASITLNDSFVTANTSSATVAKGDDLCITGNADGDPTQGIAVWILGKNYAFQTTETVDGTGAFECTLTNTTTLAAGQYFVVVQHPMDNGEYDLAPQAANPAVGQTAVVRPILDASLATGGLLPPVFILEGTGSLQGSDAATALVNAMNCPDVDDTCFRLTFMVEEPWIMIGAIGDKIAGDTFSITGTTNLAVSDNLKVNITSAMNSTASISSGTIPVTAGDKDGVNVWEFSVDTAPFTPDEYIVKVEGVEASQTATHTFNVLDVEPTPEPTPTPVPTPKPTYDVTSSLSPGWNLISTPVDAPAINASPFLYDIAYGYNTTTGTYEEISLEDMIPGEGYWVGAFTYADIEYTGDVLSEYEKCLYSGWNLIGGIGIATEAGSIHASTGALSGTTYCYNPDEHVYSQASVLEPGLGYWITTTEPCTICVNITPPAAPA